MTEFDHEFFAPMDEGPVIEPTLKISPETRELFEAMRRVVDYDWSTEANDFNECENIGEDTSTHVFLDLQRIDTFLRGIGLP